MKLSLLHLRHQTAHLRSRHTCPLCQMTTWRTLGTWLASLHQRPTTNRHDVPQQSTVGPTAKFCYYWNIFVSQAAT